MTYNLKSVDGVVKDPTALGDVCLSAEARKFVESKANPAALYSRVMGDGVMQIAHFHAEETRGPITVNEEAIFTWLNGEGVLARGHMVGHKTNGKAEFILDDLHIADSVQAVDVIAGLKAYAAERGYAGLLTPG